MPGAPTPKAATKTLSTITKAAAAAQAKTPHPPKMKITPRRSSARGHANHGWLNSYHTFSFASYYDPSFQSFGALRVLNEDRVAPSNGFPTHQHRDAEIFSYILSGELTHRDSMLSADKPADKNDFFRLRRDDVQFTTGGTGIAHSEFNEDPRTEVHFLQIWATPWRRGLPPIYHTETFPESSKVNNFVMILSPLKAGPKATREEEQAAVPRVEGTIPIHADFLMGATIVGEGVKVGWRVGCGGSDVSNVATPPSQPKHNPSITVHSLKNRKLYIHLPMRKVGARIRIAGEVVLGEGDGAFIEGVDAGVEVSVEGMGGGEKGAELVVLDSE